MNSYDIAVLGGGPGGYVAAIRAAKLGMSVALIEGSELGGTCLNRGCIPSKTLLHMAEVSEMIKKAGEWGIKTGPVEYSWKTMLDRQGKVMGTLRSGIAGLLKANKIAHIRGWGKVVSPHEIEVSSGEETTKVTADKVILATGSKPFVPPIPGLEDVPYHTSDTIFNLEHIPASMTIIGGGVIGVEFAAIFSAFGTKVNVIEAAERIVPSEDESASQALTKALKQRGVTIMTGTKVESASYKDAQIHLSATGAGRPIEQTADILLVAVGRTPNLAGLEQMNLKMNGRFVSVSEYMETSIEHVFAIGDLTGGWQLAHVASAEGLIAAANAAGKREKIDYRVVPRCIYTHPEIASVGMTEQDAKNCGLSYKVQTYSLKGNGKALSTGETDGFVKLIADEKYGEILGVTMVGPHVTDMIATASAFMHLEGTVTEWANLIHPHPTVSESLFEVANGWLGMGVNH
ncbi:dihydrolipoyl dehydrogenase [Paenibacillus tyrfis]|uniref:Dihydrolipoyl dehydrogenase n=1 Tax=Paenibacillus tyrfis TaxID=1501230 RepID=A0A081NT56_9BACL|nr:dihydrolipoyl dehydrogenase [Paenibacillus tyrfis]KEQ21629.1 acetoin dehydrogenase [Paenibacillus tyrfis]